MPTNVFIELADVASEALKAAGVANGRVFHIFPDEAARATSAVALGVEAADIEAGGLAGAPIDWSVTMRVDCFCHFGVSNGRPHDGVAQLYGEVFAVLMSSADLNGRGWSFEPVSAQWNYTDDERQEAVLNARFSVRMRTGALALEAF